ncbi:MULTISPECIES: hypothetical protein [unclassified Novosphingobium]|uniref:hypothetical protein n=1 Tax=unclassified Novosphingobium TaxID=2644732 RepID=UPI00135A1B3F|nr:MULTISPECIES: hypothetical protein [unclassified Novosphingobium]
MSGGGGISRGHPVMALLAVLGGWVGGRAATWEPPFAAALQVAAQGASGPEGGSVADSWGGPQSLPGTGLGLASADTGPVYPGGSVAASAASTPYWRYAALPALTAGQGWNRSSSIPADPAHIPRHLRSEFALTESLPRFYAPEPPGMSRPPSSSASTSVEAGPQRVRRWSADAWALLRRDESGAPASPGALPATYGASQAGAVLRYRLAPTSAYRPTAYMRTTSTLGQLQETSAALGLSARPLPSFPVIAALEARLTDQGGRRRFQPVALAVTELPWFALPADFRGEAYGQAGYVAGRFATPFADGQFKADRALVSLGKVQARIGAGVWGGAQKGAARLDAGPSASLAMPLGRGTAGRVAIDWRFRLAGDAVPNSGPALTLSAGF